MPRKPKNLDQYTTISNAAKGLEALAKDLRERSEDGLLMRWNINMGFWHPSWDAATSKQRNRISTP